MLERFGKVGSSQYKSRRPSSNQRTKFEEFDSTRAAKVEALTQRVLARTRDNIENDRSLDWGANPFAVCLEFKVDVDSDRWKQPHSRTAGYQHEYYLKRKARAKQQEFKRKQELRNNIESNSSNVPLDSTEDT